MTLITFTRDYSVVWPGDENEESTLHVQLTEEGIIADVFRDDVLVGTWAMTDQELTETIQERSN